MNVKAATVLVLLVVFAMAAAPATASEGISDGDVRISIPEVGFDSSESSTTPVISLTSNSSKTLNVYMFNKSDEVVAVVLKSAKLDGVATLTPDSSSSDVLPNDYCLTSITIKAMEYAKSGGYELPMAFYVQSLSSEGKISSTITFKISISSAYNSDDLFNKFFGIIPNTLEGPLGEPWFASLATMVALLLMNILLCYIIVPLFTSRVKRGVSKLEKLQLKKSVTRIMSVLMFMYSLSLCAQIIGASPSLCHIIDAVSTFVYVCVGALLVWRIYVFVIHALFKEVDDIEIEGVDSSLLPLFKMFGQIIIAVAAVAAILASLGVDFAGILMSAGVVSLGITMGAQNVLGQFFSGIVLLATRPFRKGDFIKVNGTVYIVKKVKLMFTELYTWEVDQTVTMPNNVLTAATIVNVTKETKEIRVYVYMSIAYEADIELAKKLMIQAATEHPHVITNERRSPPSTRLTNFLDSGIEIRLAAYVDDFDSSGTYAGELRERMFALFQENGVEIPYTKYEVTLKQPCDGRKRPDDNFD
ncbi:MAG: mechanosensitive ion channel [Candidatus Methanomethylophilaceae archaeon]|nr:mechanosensitive ion channel [Candidatus Methanomethylophilaceae archaeon]